MEDFKKYTATKNKWNFEHEGHNFSCEEITVGEVIDFFNYYIELDGTQNIAKLKMVRATKLEDTPFTPEWIAHVYKEFYPKVKIKEGITWEELLPNPRLMFLLGLEPLYVGKLVKIVSEHYDQKEETIKN